MSQGLLATVDDDGAGYIAQVNDALARLATMASGTARPSDVAAGELWRETDNPGAGVHSIWLYDGASDVLVGTLDTVTHAITWSGSLASLLTTQGDIAYRNATVPARLAAGADAYKALFTGGSGANPAWAGTWKVLGEATPSGAAAVDFTGIPAAVHHLMLMWELLPGTNAVGLDMQTYGADGVLDTGGGDYLYTLIAMNSGGASGIGANGAIDRIKIHSTPGISNNSSYASNGFATLKNIQAARYTAADIHSSMLSSDGNYWRFDGVGVRNEADRITGLRLVPTSGTISGRALLLGSSN